MYHSRAYGRGVLQVSCSQTRPCLKRVSNGSKIEIPESGLVVGSSAEVDLVITCNEVLPKHCRFDFQSGRLFCTSFNAEDDETLIPSDTSVWLNGSALRCGVKYLVPSQARIEFGDRSEAVIAEFEEFENGKGDMMAQMLIQGMMSQASDEVKAKFEETN